MPYTDSDLEEQLFFSQLVSQCSAMQLLKQLLMHSHHAIVITDADHENGHKMVYANKAFCNTTGYSLAELVGLSPRILQGPRSNTEILKRLKPELTEKGFFYGASINYRKDGSIYPVEWNISEIKNDQGEVTHYVSIQKDLTNLKELATQIRDSNKIFKQYYIEHKRSAVPSSQQQDDSILEHLIQNEKIYSNSMRDPELCELFEEAFFDFSPGEYGALSGSESKTAISAAEFMEEQPIEDDDLSALLESINEVETEIALLVSQGASNERVQNIANRFQEVAKNLYFCIEFNDGALIIDEVAKRLSSLKQPENVPDQLLVAFNKEVFDWLHNVFVTQNAANVFEGENNTVAAGHQLLAFLD